MPKDESNLDELNNLRHNESMRITLITGDAPRHQHLFSKLQSTGLEIQWFIEKRKRPDTNLKITDKKIKDFAQLHFEDWWKSENSFFNSTNKKLVPNSKISIASSSTINGDFSNQIKDWNPKLIISYGCSKIGQNIIELPGIKKINIHGGLSPWYRGTITNFWPTYLLEPQFTGMTLHETTNQIDGGKIFFQTSITVDSNLGINQNSCVAILDFIDQFTNLMEGNLEKILSADGLNQMSSGRIWTNSMWSPHHLAFVYGYMNNEINKYCIENELLERKPSLINVF